MTARLPPALRMLPSTTASAFTWRPISRSGRHAETPDDGSVKDHDQSCGDRNPPADAPPDRPPGTGASATSVLDQEGTYPRGEFEAPGIARSVGGLVVGEPFPEPARFRADGGFRSWVEGIRLPEDVESDGVLAD